METNDKTYCVYKHVSPSGKVYIGITCQIPERRWNNGNGYIHNKYFTNAILKYGWENIEHEILFKNLSENDAKNKEIELIHLYGSLDRSKGYNISPGGTSISHETRLKISEKTKKQWENQEYRDKMIEMSKGNKNWLGKHHSEKHKKYMSEIMSGRTISIETRRKISQANKNKYAGELNPFYGKKHSEETKNKISEANKGNKYWLGKKHSEETKNKISNSNKGRKQSEHAKHLKSLASKRMWDNDEFKIRMSEQRKGMNAGMKNPMAKKIICLNTKQIFNCIKDASLIYGAYSGISKCCKGKAKTAGKINGEPLKWMYYEDYLKLNEEK